MTEEEVMDGEAICALIAIVLWICALVALILGIWLPSWQWALSGPLAFFAGCLSMYIGERL